MVEGGRGCSKVRRSNHCHHGGDERHLIAGRANIHEATRPRPTRFTQDMRRTAQKKQEHNEASQTGNDTVDWTICRPPSISFNLRIMNKPTNHPSARPTNAQIDRPTDRLTDRPTDRPGSNVHQMVTVTNILPHEFLATAIICSLVTFRL